MLQALRNKQREDGFTLIELMVVVLIIAILIAIAIPTFLGARERAQDKGAQSDLRNALTAAKVLYTDASDYQDATAAELVAVEPSLSFVAGAASGSADVVGVTTTADTVLLTKVSASGTAFCIYDNVANPSAGTTYGSGAAIGDVDAAGDCGDASW